jgi:hypothetical protein
MRLETENTFGMPEAKTFMAHTPERIIVTRLSWRTGLMRMVHCRVRCEFLDSLHHLPASISSLSLASSPRT